MPASQLERRFSRQWIVVIAACVLLGICAFWVARETETDALDRALQAQRETVLLEATTLRYRLEAETLSTFHLITGLGSYISVNPELSQAEFDRFAETIFKAHPGLVNVAAAPDMIIRYVYPLAGNEAALGLDYTTHPHQRAAAMQVKETGAPVVAGPVALVQGGTALIGRFPVYSGGPEGKRFWGIISTPLDTAQLYESTGLTDPALSIDVAIRGRDGKGERGEVFFGPLDFFSDDALRLPVRIFSGAWEIGAKPKGGWAQTAPNATMIRVVAVTLYLLLVLILVMINVYVIRLERSRQREARVSHAKSRFLANMSHEVRTPLNGISGVAQLLRYKMVDEDQSGLADVIVRSVESLNDLLNNILNLSKLESGKFHVNEDVVELEPIVDSLLSVIRIEAEQKKLRFDFSGVPHDRRVVLADATIIRQILWNLLSNALKFTAAGSVRLDLESVKMKGDGSPGLRLAVSDTGIGISPERREVIFDGYVQEDATTSRRYGGTGLGLAIVKRLVEQLKGEIRLDSEKGKGSRFEVDVPVRISLE